MIMLHASGSVPDEARPVFRVSVAAGAAFRRISVTRVSTQPAHVQALNPK